MILLSRDQQYQIDNTASRAPGSRLRPRVARLHAPSRQALVPSTRLLRPNPHPHNARRRPHRVLFWRLLHVDPSTARFRAQAARVDAAACSLLAAYVQDAPKDPAICIPFFTIMPSADAFPGDLGYSRFIDMLTEEGFDSQLHELIFIAPRGRELLIRGHGGWLQAIIWHTNMDLGPYLDFFVRPKSGEEAAEA